MTTSMETDNILNEYAAMGYATVTFAIYDDAPIACQGDDDHRKIQVLRKKIRAGKDMHAEALRVSVELDGLFVQVWDVQVTEPPTAG